jgi:cysteine desulfurase/selenocysteine lyase
MSAPTLHTTRASDTSTRPVFDVDRIRRDFPILSSEVNGHPLVYFDNAATTQKPQQVLDAITSFYSGSNSNVHRGVHTLSQTATDVYEAARTNVAEFLNARVSREVVFTGGTTDSINIVASAFAKSELGPGDEVIVTELEHHSNFVPWQQACLSTGATLRVIATDLDGRIDLRQLEESMSERSKLVAITHVSNTLGNLVDLSRVVEIAHGHNVPVLSDGAQAVPHFDVDVQALDIDFYAFSGHKVFAPMGIGVLYGKETWLDRLQPTLTGGGMIDLVSPSSTTWADLPHKFEAGTPNVAGAAGLAAALDYLRGTGRHALAAHENRLSEHMRTAMLSIDGVKLLGPNVERTAVFSFVAGSAHPFDIGSLLDQLGFAVRTGHHCNQPLMKRMGVSGTVRASLAFYNTHDEVDRFIAALTKVLRLLN